MINYWDRTASVSLRMLTVQRTLLALYGLFVVLLSHDWITMSSTLERHPSGGGALWHVMGTTTLAAIALLLLATGTAPRIAALVAATATSLLILLTGASLQPRPHFGALVTALLLYAAYPPPRDRGSESVRAWDVAWIRWLQLYLATGYALDAVVKLRFTGLPWITDPSNMRLYVLGTSENRGFLTRWGRALIEGPDIAVVMVTAGTIVAELSLLILLITRLLPVSVAFVGLTVMHVGIAAVMNIWYVFYFVPLYLMFADLPPWTSVSRRIPSNELPSKP